MIGRLLAELGGRVATADAVATVDETTSVIRDVDGTTAISVAESHQVQVRIADRDRVGWAGGEAAFAAEVVEAAMRSVGVGDPAALFLPAPSPLPSVVTRSPATGALGVTDLVRLAEQLHDRVRGRGLQIEVFAERSIGSAEIGNTRGVAAEYQTTLMGCGAMASLDGGPPFRAHHAQVGPIEAAEVEALVHEVQLALGPKSLEATSPPRSIRVWFAPRAVRALLQPVLALLMGEEWLLSRERWPTFDQRVTLVDDPLQPGRPGSRPVDDDGVPTRRLVLIDRGLAARGILDLATGSRHRLPSTGHGWRRGFAPPRVGFSNVMLESGEADQSELAAAADDGLLVRDLRFGPAPNPTTGVFRVAVPWTYQLTGGEVVGRLEGVVLFGNVFELLGRGRVVAIGNDPTWIGAASVPSLVVDGVGLNVT